jgi:ribosomal protein L37AE/L43A
VADDRPRGSCVICYQVDPREGVVCDRDRQRLAQALWELRDLHALLPFALVPGQGARQPGRVVQVEAPLSFRDTALDLTGRTATYGFRDSVQDYRGDQHGAQPVAAILDSWARDWSAIREDEELPDPTVDALVSWLSRRLPWALDVHPAIDEFAHELTVTLYVVRSTLSVSMKPLYSDLACPRCGTAALRRQAGDKVWRCAECRTEVEVEHPDECECGCGKTVVPPQ